MSARGSWEEAVAWLVSQPDKRDLVLGSYFDSPLKDAALRFWQSPEWQAVRNWLPLPPGHAVDMGAGNGIATFALARDGWHVTAVEPDPSNTVGAGAIQELMRSAQLPVTIVGEFGENLPIESESIDVIVARQVLHHARDLRKLCRESIRLLRPGGTLVALRDHVISRPRDLPRFLARHPLHARYGGECAYTLHQYRAALVDAGFTIVRMVRPFESVVNYAPYNREDLRRILAVQFGFSFLTLTWSRLLQNDRVFDRLLALLSYVDRTPGRLYSFVCRKPSALSR